MDGVLGQILRCALQTVPGAIGAHHRGTVRALSRCRTGELGYLLHVCSDCGDTEHVPKSCGNRHCPQCHGRLARAWLDSQQHALLDTLHFHVVCALPHVLLPLCVAAPREIYALLFDACSGMLLRLGSERLGSEIGITLVLPLETFVRRFLLHILPTSFTKIRHYGLLSNGVRARRLPLARSALAAARRRRAPRKAEHVTKDNPAAPPRCRHCDGGEPVCVAFITPAARRSPSTVAHASPLATLHPDSLVRPSSFLLVM